jgi:hypothetical protein
MIVQGQFSPPSGAINQALKEKRYSEPGLRVRAPEFIFDLLELFNLALICSLAQCRYPTLYRANAAQQSGRQLSKKKVVPHAASR